MSVVVVDHPAVQHRLGLLRTRPANPLFRLYTQELCRFLSYEASRYFALEEVTVQGFSGEVQVKRLQGKNPTAVPILRAGLGMLPGFLDVFPEAPVSMIGLRRNEETLQPETYYANFIQDMGQRTAFILDPMLATGGSFVAAVDLVKSAGCTQCIGLCMVASEQGLATVQQAHDDVLIYTCAVDPILNGKGYIVPGLGDAGDLIFGTTL